MLIAEIEVAGAQLWLNTRLTALRGTDPGFAATLERDGQSIDIIAENVIVATGGKSIPTMGATGLAYDIARQFGMAVTEPRPGSRPPHLSRQPLHPACRCRHPYPHQPRRHELRRSDLFTHRGLSGPAILQISCYWRKAKASRIDLLPGSSLASILREKRRQEGRRALTTELAHICPPASSSIWRQVMDLKGNLGDLSDARMTRSRTPHSATGSVTPGGSEGYRTAEVTLGGIDTAGLSSTSMMSRPCPGSTSSARRSM